MDARTEFLDAEVEFHAPEESDRTPGSITDLAGRTYFDRLSEVMEEQRVESVDVIDVDNHRVIAVVKDSPTRRTSRGKSR